MYWIPVILILPYFFLLLKIYRNLLKITSFKATIIPSTYVSVIIPCRNGQDKLPVTLQSISGQDYPGELFEVLIVDDNSTDRTFETVSENTGIHRLYVLKNKGSGKKESIRTGINASTGNLIITTDADCIMGKSWIRTIAAFFENNSPDMIIGPVQINRSRGFFGRFQELEFMSLQGVTAGSVMAGNGIMCNGANLAFTRATYLNNSDDLHFGLPTGDDVFLLHSLKKQVNARIMWLESTDSAVTTDPALTLGSYLRQRRRWISKWNVYTDSFTIVTGIVTFAATMVQLAAFISIFFNISFIWLFLIIMALKSVPDYLILRNTTGRYGKKHLMHWFLPAQLIYPLYVTGVLLYSMLPLPSSKEYTTLED
jgi:cellulose synthase/poly-beta-1,6-N-acetylglucosamine synthase-like glycosyltransferase